MIGDILKKLRNERNLTSEELCNKIGIKGGSYRNYERNDRKPDYETLIKLADYYNVTTDYLLGRPEAKPPEDPISNFCNALNLNLYERAIVTAYLAMDKENRSALSKLVQNAAEKIKNEQEAEEDKKKTPNIEVNITRPNKQMNIFNNNENNVTENVEYQPYAARDGEAPGIIRTTEEEKAKLLSALDLDWDL